MSAPVSLDTPLPTPEVVDITTTTTPTLAERIAIVATIDLGDVARRIGAVRMAALTASDTVHAALDADRASDDRDALLRIALRHIARAFVLLSGEGNV